MESMLLALLVHIFHFLSLDGYRYLEVRNAFSHFKDEELRSRKIK